MRTAAEVLSGVAAGAAAAVLVLTAVRLRWERSEYGWHTVVSLFAVTGLLAGLRATYEGLPWADAAVALSLALMLPLAVWRVVIIMRAPRQ